MSISYSRGVQPVWTIRDRNGEPLKNCWLWSYRDDARDEFKAIYTEPSGAIAWTNPILSDNAGTFQNLYFVDDEPYYLEISRDRNGLVPIDVVDTIEHYVPSGAGGGSPVTTTIDIKNYVVNGQFTDHYAEKSGSQLFPAEHELVIAEGGWYFSKDDGGATDALKFISFPLGITDPEANPSVYLDYTCTAGAISETYKVIEWRVPNVRLFSGEQISISFDAKSSNSSNLKVDIRQYFGTGGSPSSTSNVNVYDDSLTPSWQKIPIPNEGVPSISGKTLGTNGDDYFALVFRLPINSVSNLGLVNVQIERRSTISPYERESRQEQNERRTGAILPPITDKDIGKVLTVNRFFNPTGINPILGWNGGYVPVGSIVMFGSDQASALPAGWFFCDGNTLFRWIYPLLFRSLFNTSVGGPLWGVEPKWSFTIDIPVANPYKLLTALPAQPPDITIPATTAGTMPGSFVITLVTPGSPTAKQEYSLTFPAASVITPGMYWLTSTNGTSIPEAQYYVWYTINGIGIDPEIPGRVGLRVDIADTDDALGVTSKTSEVLIDTVFYLPDLRNLFVRGWGDEQPGHEETDTISTHIHHITPVVYSNNQLGGSSDIEFVVATDPPLSPPLTPPNKRIAFIIKHD